MQIINKRLQRLVLWSGLLGLLNTGSVAAQANFPDPDIQFLHTHQGDLVLANSTTLIIENTHYKIDGSIIVKDSAQLIIRQSIIEFTAGEGEGAALRLLGSASVQADTTIFGGGDLVSGIDPSQAEAIKPGDILAFQNSQVTMNNCFSLLQTFGGNSSVTIDDSYLVLEPLGLVHVEDSADVLIEDSFVGAFFIAIPDGVPVVIDSLNPGYFDYWSVREAISDSIKYNLILRRTQVMENTKGFKGGMEIGWNIGVNALNSIVTISNSKLGKLVISFPNAEPAFLSDLFTRVPIDFDLNNIHVSNTEIQTQWGVFMHGGPAEIINSEGLFIFMTGGNSDILVANSEVGEIDPRKYTGSLIFEQSTWLGGYEIFDSSAIAIRGSVRMLPTVPIFDRSSTMTRVYDVFLLDDLSGAPFVNVSLTLYKDSVTVWSGTTDAEGKVSFDITFDYNNFDDRWLLSTDSSYINLNKAFSIRISNPVKISLELEEDSIHYRPVIHVAENPGFPHGTKESPYPTVQEGIDNSGGDIVYVHPALYTGDIAPGKTRGVVTLKDSVTILGASADSTILMGSVNAENVSGAQISGFTIEDGVHALFSSLILNNNVIAGYGGTAIWGSHSDFQIVNNVLANNSQDGIFLHDSSTAIIKNNIIVRNGSCGIIGSQTASATIDYNDVWGNATNYDDFFPAGPHDISEDPMFVDSVGDFHLQSGSPCIDAGDPAAQFNDLDGTRNDLGAYGGRYFLETLTGVADDDRLVPDHLTLFQNYPNPFNPMTTINFSLLRRSHVNISVYNILGQKVITLIDEDRSAGTHTLTWDGKSASGSEVSTGIYIYRMQAGEYIRTKKMILLK
ncbi:MAG: right-handed parallel beta-helix repeat-containing protein [Candidatus Thorarchaeota archaeon]